MISSYFQSPLLFQQCASTVNMEGRSIYDLTAHLHECNQYQRLMSLLLLHTGLVELQHLKPEFQFIFFQSFSFLLNFSKANYKLTRTTKFVFITKNYHFCISSRPTMDPNQLPIHCVPGDLSLGVKRQGRETGHSPKISAEIKKIRMYTSIPSCFFMA
jgi:hypothetical protein